ncbi:GNAT family N-acetyltransferase [Bacillus sp. NPDC077027]|uniref:GNAT family N-acetyltransferase n=1 Tax=Bacillus sp. NPDC077027 TaxID=3390548 RepID=UPI003D01C54E
MMTNVMQTTLTLDDIPDLLTLSKEVQWPDYSTAELTFLLSNGQFTGFKTAKGQVIACAGLFQYDQMASIGAVIVSETYRGLGLARKMIETLLEQSDQHCPVVLTATALGQPVYEKLGFQTVSHIHTYQSQQPIPSAIEQAERIHVSPYHENEFSAIVAIDQQSVGANRSSFLKSRIDRATFAKIAKENTQETIGFGLGIETPANLIIGPLTAKNKQTALALVHTMISSFSGAVRLDMHEHTANLLHDTLLAAGFVKTSISHFMMLRGNEKRNNENLLYFLASQAFA